ncbi:MAG TPA: hypothetical protein VFW50_11020 [Streptosporangiaceae bacterium]|nr:hypothetical protein [Streptosporangiaceae bacterium]
MDIQLSGSDDVIALHLNIPIEFLVYLFRIGFFAFPVIGFFVTRHVCLALQRADARKLKEGESYGIAVAGPTQAYVAVNRPLPEEARVLAEARQPAELLVPTPRHIVPLPTPRRISAQVRARLNHFYVRRRLENPKSLALLNGHEPDGQGPDGQGPDGQGPDGQGPDGQGPDGQEPDEG